MKQRCEWVSKDPLYIKYHDEEWGRPIKDDTILFEFLVLESFQAGLSWLTILHKRENFREAFDHFNYHKIAQYSEEKIKELMQNTGIVRHQLKILSTINNAQKFIEIQNEYGSFSNFIWNFTNHKIIYGNWNSIDEVPASSPLSNQVFKALKNKGFKFLGTSTVYAYLQAIGIVNDHVKHCFCHYQQKH